EMALALVLLIGAGLMIRSLNALWNVDPGFRADNLLTFDLSFPPSLRTADPDAIRAAMREVGDRIRSTPGVQSASLSWGSNPFQGNDDLYFWLGGQPRPASQSEMNMALVYRVEPQYLTAMGIALKRGRFFTDQDNDRSPNVAVIDEVFAGKYFPNENPIGKRLNTEGKEDQWQIVGVVGHVKQFGLDSDDSDALQAQLYLPFRALSNNALPLVPAGVNVMARSRFASREAGPAFFDSIRRAIQGQNSQNVVFRLQSMNEVIAGTLTRRRFSMALLGAFAATALLMASVGLYGVISYLVGQRTHELGVRIALGARRMDVLRLVVNHGMRMALSGVALGVVAALGLTRLLSQMLYGVSPTDPATFTIIASLLMAVALLACFVPAWRASKVDPLVALRHE
ncbi:MAG TPA: ABC transporter permease, partial [Blastocatellia bacterium]|nr:ABC transporter permease [Blastocatellia bacterium]